LAGGASASVAQAREPLALRRVPRAGELRAVRVPSRDVAGTGRCCVGGRTTVSGEAALTRYASLRLTRPAPAAILRAVVASLAARGSC